VRDMLGPVRVLNSAERIKRVSGPRQVKVETGTQLYIE
jgi:hypothetical protein